MAKKPVKVKDKEPKELPWVCCGKCANCTPLTEPEKLSVRGEPILGRCPYWTQSKSTLLSWMMKCKHYVEAAPASAS